MDNQAILNTVVAHARKQKAKALIGFACRYRTCEGLKCFFGCLIPDNLYDKQMEGKGVRSSNSKDTREIFQSVFDHLGVQNDNDIDFLGKLQRIHDSRDIEYWENEFKTFAEKYSLVVPPIALESPNNIS